MTPLGMSGSKLLHSPRVAVHLFFVKTGCRCAMEVCQNSH